jgi:hypothetical protein
MNPLLVEALASVVRHVLTIGAGYLVARGIWTPEDASTYAMAGALAIIGTGWGLYQKYTARTKLVTALASSTITTEAAIERKIAQGEQAEVTTPKTEKPYLEVKP